MNFEAAVLGFGAGAGMDTGRSGSETMESSRISMTGEGLKRNAGAVVGLFARTGFSLVFSACVSVISVFAMVLA